MSGTTFWHRMIGQREGYTRLGVLNVLTSLTDVLDQKVALNEIEFETTGVGGAKAPLSNEELAEVGEYLNAIIARITTFYTARMDADNVAYRTTLPSDDPWYLSPSEAANISLTHQIGARDDVEGQLRNYLLNSESGSITLAEFRTLLGLS